MKKLVTAAVAVAAAATIGGGAMAFASPDAQPAQTKKAVAASPEDENQGIIAGSRAPYTEWAVMLESTDGRATQGCTGQMLNAQWILTAKHCIDGAVAMNAYFSNSTSNPGRPYRVDRMLPSPYGDLALAHLAQPKRLNSYAPIADSYTPRSGDRGTIMGFGARAWGAHSSGLFQAEIRVDGPGRDLYGGQAIHLYGVTGAANHGDSGGPLLVNGRVVGVCSKGDTNDPGGDARSGSYYGSVTASRSWIRSRAGV